MIEEPQYNPEMLILAREAAKLTQTGLSRITPYAQSIISRMESGQLPISTENARRFSEAMNVPITFFEQRDRIQGLGASFLYHRKRQSMPIRDVRKIEADVNIIKMHIAHMLRGVDWSSEYEFVPMNVGIDGTPSELARLTRANWRLPSGPIQNLTRAAETAGGFIVRYPFHVSQADGVHLWATGLPPVFVLNSNLPGDRVRWTLAHEIGHAVMHRAITKDIEDEANEFAGELLLPLKQVFEVLRNLTLPIAAALKLVWKVSMQALIRRAYNIGAIDHRRYRSLYVQLSKAGYRKEEPNQIAVEVSSNVERIIQYHFSENEYTVEDLAAMIRCNRNTFQDMYVRDIDEPHLRIAR